MAIMGILVFSSISYAAITAVEKFNYDLLPEVGKTSSSSTSSSDEGSSTPQNNETCTYGLEKCLDGMICDSCTKLDGTKRYKFNSCKTEEGWEKNSLLNVCQAVACPEGYSTGTTTCEGSQKLETSGVSGGKDCGKCVSTASSCSITCNATNHPLTSIPVNATYSDCSCDGTTRYKITSCDFGYKISADDDKCNKITCATGYGLNDAGDDCEACANNEISENNQCEACPSNATVSNNTCVCNANYTMQNGQCVRVACDAPLVLNNGECVTCEAIGTKTSVPEGNMCQQLEDGCYNSCKSDCNYNGEYGVCSKYVDSNGNEVCSYDKKYNSENGNNLHPAGRFSNGYSVSTMGNYLDNNGFLVNFEMTVDDADIVYLKTESKTYETNDDFSLGNDENYKAFISETPHTLKISNGKTFSFNNGSIFFIDIEADKINLRNTHLSSLKLTADQITISGNIVLDDVVIDAKKIVIEDDAVDDAVLEFYDNNNVIVNSKNIQGSITDGIELGEREEDFKDSTVLASIGSPKSSVEFTKGESSKEALMVLGGGNNAKSIKVYGYCSDDTPCFSEIYTARVANYGMQNNFDINIYDLEGLAKAPMFREYSFNYYSTYNDQKYVKLYSTVFDKENSILKELYKNTKVKKRNYEDNNSCTVLATNDENYSIDYKNYDDALCVALYGDSSAASTGTTSSIQCSGATCENFGYVSEDSEEYSTIYKQVAVSEIHSNCDINSWDEEKCYKFFFEVDENESNEPNYSDIIDALDGSNIPYNMFSDTGHKIDNKTCYKPYIFTIQCTGEDGVQPSDAVATILVRNPDYASGEDIFATENKSETCEELFERVKSEGKVTISLETPSVIKEFEVPYMVKRNLECTDKCKVVDYMQNPFTSDKCKVCVYK